MASKAQQFVVDVPQGYPTTAIFLDESGVKATDRFTVAGLKVRRIGRFARDLKDLRDRHNFHTEFKFNTINDGSLDFCYELIDLIERSDAQLVGCVVDAAVCDPFKPGRHRWEGHAAVTSQLLVGCINRRELVSVLMDGISAPRECSLEDTIRGQVNRRFGMTSVVTAVCLDSATNDTLQVADLVASSIAFERRRLAGGQGSPSSAKGKVAGRLGVAIGNPGLLDGRQQRFNIATYQTSRGASRAELKVVSRSGRSA